jgi:segregation and condensation protein A
MSSYELRLDTFSGPLEKLLELIDKRELDITAISLAAVTNDFIEYVRSLDNVSPALLADFISIASQLLLLKSRALLPTLPLTDEEESEIQGLEERLRIYQELRHAFNHIRQSWRLHESMHGRNYMPTISLVNTAESGDYYPGSNLNVEGVVGATNAVLSFLERVQEDKETVREKIVRLEDKMTEIIARMQGAARTNIKDLSQSGTKSELIVIFLALLHLAREQMIDLEQEGQFSDIMVSNGRISSDEFNQQNGSIKI